MGILVGRPVKKPCRATWLLIVLLAGAGSAAAQVAGGPGLSATQIVRAAGIKAGLCVHLDVSDGKLTADLAKEGKFVVHGIAATPAGAEAARKLIASRGLYGKVSVEQGALSRLPYVSDLVNLVVVEDTEAALRNGLSIDEVVRVLCPGGVAYFGRPGDARARLEKKSGVKGFEVLEGDATRLLIRKVRPAEMGEWTHWLHGPEGNNHSEDTLAGPAVRMQWIDGPTWLTGHNVAELFAGGRSFNVTQDPRSPGGRLIARDAFNGLVLWERAVETGGAAVNPRLLVAAGDRVYAVVEKDGPAVALDAATGKVVRTYDAPASPKCILFVDGWLVLGSDAEIRSVNAVTGEVRWRIPAPKDASFVLKHPGPAPLVLYMPPYMVSGDGRLFVHIKDAPQAPYTLASYDLATGEEKWRKRQPGEILAYYRGALMLYEVRKTTKPRNGNEEETGVYHALAAEDGRNLWDCGHSRGDFHGVWDDPSYAAGLIWVGQQGLDPMTGEMKRQLKTGLGPGHCARHITTDRYIIAKMTSFISLEKDKLLGYGYYKNGCGVGQIPANGLVYTFPISCSCIAYVRGYVAFSPAEAAAPAAAETSPRLEKGPAYGLKPTAAETTSEWNTYRRDPSRSGSTSDDLPRDLKRLWSVSVNSEARTTYGRAITPPVAAEGMVFVAAPDAQQVSALDAATGALRWRYLTGARVETPPTIYRGLCLFGSNDGWVYCLRASDGVLVWRFRAAPEERRFMARDRLESPWPVPNVLVEKSAPRPDGTRGPGGVAYFVAGWHSKLPDGLVAYALDPFTADVRWEKRVDNSKAETWYDNHTNDLLLSDGESLFMCQLRFDPKTGERSRTWRKGGDWTHRYLIAGQGRDTSAVIPFGFLYDRNDGAAMERYDSTYWAYRGAKGLLLSFTQDRVFGVKPQNPRRTVPVVVFGRKFDDAVAAGENAEVWAVTVSDATISAVLPAGSAVFAAGAPLKAGADKGLLRVYAAADGKLLSELALDDAPVFDGMAAADGRLYVATQSGRILCLGAK